MRNKLWIALVLAPLSFSATADWQVLGTNSQAKITVYVDMATKIRNGQLVKMWTLTDLQVPREQGIRSEKIQHEYDCQESKTRILSVMGYSGNMGDGVVRLDVDTPQDWRPVPPDSSIFERWKLACDKD